MKKVLAISGGVDSMVLLDLFGRDPDAVVAHFNHGTRPSADADAEFVKRAADSYGIPFYLGTAKLGANVSEACAREARYEFLSEIASEVDGEIYTAHHINDLAETIVINIIRGTGWRGLSPFGREKIVRIFLDTKPKTRADIDVYASTHSLAFRQDPTNVEDKYLRNRVREKISLMSQEKLLSIFRLYQKQQKLRLQIEQLVRELMPADGRYERKWFLKLDDVIALEFLRASLLKVGVSATRPQLMDFLSAIRNYAPEKTFNLPGGKMVVLHKTYFVLQ